jgi:hypothetical protein
MYLDGDQQTVLSVISGDIHDFLEAAQDFRYLLSRGYPRLGALTYVGNRYQLPKQDREIMGRGVYPGHESLARRNKLLTAERVTGRAVIVDGYNVIITLESAFYGRPLIECDDGPIRDASWVSNSYRTSEITDHVLKMIMNSLSSLGALSIVFLLFSSMSMSGELAVHISAMLSGRGLLGRAQALANPARDMAEFPGIVATSNSVLIERVAEPFDLAGHIIRQELPDVPVMSLNLE